MSGSSNPGRIRARFSLAAAGRCGLIPALLLLVAACKDGTGPGTPAIACAADGSVTVNGQAALVAPGGYVPVGNKLYSVRTCEPRRFVGVGIPALSFDATGGRLGDPATASADFATIKSWGANTVRIELAQYFWVPTSRFYNPDYAGRVERAVSLARAADLDVILALQYSDRGDPNYPGDPLKTNMHQPMPDVNHSVPFWRDVANRFKGDGRIMFELYSEPYPLGGAGGFSNWELWLNGGTAPADETYEPRAAYQAVGMQQLYDEVRKTGAHNIILLGGTSWGYFLNGVPTHRVKGYNIAYATHPWEDQEYKQREPSGFEEHWAFLARTDPVLVTEFGAYDCAPSYYRAVLDKADQLGLSWIGWAWTAPTPGTSMRQQGKDDPICSFPMLLTDWNGTPTNTGAIVKTRMGSYR